MAQLIETPASALPPMSRICLSFMKKMMIQHDPLDKAVVRSAGELDDETRPGGKKRATPILRDEADESSSLMRLVDLDYTWLSAAE